MSSSAIMLMLVAIITIWGGLLWSVIHLIKHPDVPLESVPDDKFY